MTELTCQVAIVGAGPYGLSAAAHLRDAGIDIRSAKFWQGGFDVLSRMVDELEKL